MESRLGLEWQQASPLNITKILLSRTDSNKAKQYDLFESTAIPNTNTTHAFLVSQMGSDGRPLECTKIATDVNLEGKNSGSDKAPSTASQRVRNGNLLRSGLCRVTYYTYM